MPLQYGVLSSSPIAKSSRESCKGILRCTSSSKQQHSTSQDGVNPNVTQVRSSSLHSGRAESKVQGLGLKGFGQQVSPCWQEQVVQPSDELPEHRHLCLLCQWHQVDSNYLQGIDGPLLFPYLGGLTR
jgi:hypothetical protein